MGFVIIFEYPGAKVSGTGIAKKQLTSFSSSIGKRYWRNFSNVPAPPELFCLTAQLLQKMRALKIAVERSKAKRALDSIRKKKKAKKDIDDQLLDESD